MGRLDGKESFELLQQSLLKIPLKQETANVQYVPFETKKENEEKSLWERAWDGLKETASDVWDTVTSKEFREKALAIGGTILGTIIAGIEVMDASITAGAAMGAVVTYLGGSAAMAGATTTATTVGGYVIAGALVEDAANTSVEVATGTNLIATGAYNLFGNENWTERDFLNLYWEGRDRLYMVMQNLEQIPWRLDILLRRVWERTNLLMMFHTIGYKVVAKVVRLVNIELK